MGFKDFFVERVPEEKLDEECNYDVEDETWMEKKELRH